MITSKGIEVGSLDTQKNRWAKLKIFVCLLAGALLCAMVSILYMSENFNLDRFFSPGVVYDFPQKDLRKPSKSWVYDEENGLYQLAGDDALNKYLLNGKAKKWKYLYLTISSMDVPQMEGAIVYYTKENARVYEQPVTLSKGENMVALVDHIPIKRMGIRILNQGGENLSISSMQIRTTPNRFPLKRCMKVFSAAYIGFLVFFGCIVYYNKKHPWTVQVNGYRFVENLQYVFQIFGDGFGRRVKGKLTEKQKNLGQIAALAGVFLIMVIGNGLNWTKKADFRYYALGCLALLVLFGILSWRKPWKNVNWKHPLAAAWLCLMIGMVISDFFVNKGYGLVSSMFLVCGSFFIFSLNHSESQHKAAYHIMKALEFIFPIVCLYCMVFRRKKIGISYNGPFRSPEDLAMYASLMVSVFLTELDALFYQVVSEKEKKASKYCACYAAGAAASLYFVLRAEEPMGYLATLLVAGCFCWRQAKRYPNILSEVKKAFPDIVKWGAVAVVTVCLIHCSVKYIPSLLNTEVEYKKETLVTGKDDEAKERFQALEPDLARAKQREDRELPVIWKNYLRKINLMGNPGAVQVFREKTPAYNGYVYMMYRYGIFILVPYVVFQICMVGFAIQKIRDGAAKGQLQTDGAFWMSLVVLIFLCFCIAGNVEALLGNPLWFCFYLGSAIWFAESGKVDAISPVAISEEPRYNK